MLGVPCVIAHREGYQLSASFLQGLRKKFPKCNVTQTTDPRAAVARRTSSTPTSGPAWVRRRKRTERSRIFAPYQVNRGAAKAAAKRAKFMHCLPARRGLEVTDDVMESPHSIVFPQAENRMHLAKGLFAWQLSAR